MSQHAQYQDNEPAAKATKQNPAFDNFIIYTCASAHCLSVHLKLFAEVKLGRISESTYVCDSTLPLKMFL